MGSKMRVVIAPGGGRLATDATNVGFLPSMHLWRLMIGSFLIQLVSVTDYLQMISQIVAPGEALMTMLTLVVPVVRYIIVCTYTRQEYLVNSVISEQKPIVHNNSVFMSAFTICAVITTSQYSRHSFHQKDNNLVPECSATWRCQLLLTVNWSPHSLQTNGFTPRCERMCCSSRASRRYAWEIKIKKQKVEQELF